MRPSDRNELVDARFCRLGVEDKRRSSRNDGVLGVRRGAREFARGVAEEDTWRERDGVRLADRGEGVGEEPGSGVTVAVAVTRDRR
jgi:hypothetical protein